MTTSTMWDSRCKSGYQWDTGRRTRLLKRTVWKQCNQMTARGEVLCHDCHALLEVSLSATHNAAHASENIFVVIEQFA